MAQGYVSRNYTGSAQAQTSWSRPSDWLTLSVGANEQKIQMLWAVFQNTNNYVAFTVTGAFTVDWGDGTAPVNYASGTAVYRNLAWADYGSGTLTSRGYRQAIITITPQAAANLATFTFNPHNASGLPSSQSDYLLDLKVRGTNITSFVLRITSSITHPLMECVEFLGQMTGWVNRSSLFFGLTGLRRVLGTFDCQGATNLASMFQNCTALEQGPTFANTSSVTSTNSMFNGCSALRTVTVFDTSSVTDPSSMFASCSSLQSIPAFNLNSATTLLTFANNCTQVSSIAITTSASCTNFQQAFLGCVRITAAPSGVNFSGATTIDQVFSGCSSLTDISTVNTSATCSLFSNAFSSCVSLSSIPSTFNTAGCTTAANMFSGCRSITTMPTPSGNNWNFASCTNFTSMFQNCTSLQTIPTYATSAGTNFTSMFNGCSALQSVPAINVNAGTIFTTMFSSCTALASVAMTNIGATISFASCFLSASALDTIYGNLKTVAGQTITVTSNYGISGDTPTIATNKGWTVTGS